MLECSRIPNNALLQNFVIILRSKALFQIYPSPMQNTAFVQIGPGFTFPLYDAPKAVFVMAKQRHWLLSQVKKTKLSTGFWDPRKYGRPRRHLN
jgi:hypothetical protein